MITISLAGKGSSGKSTLLPTLVMCVRALAPALCVLVFDADPHMSGTRMLGVVVDRTLGQLRSAYERQLKVDPANSQIFLIYKAGGEPEKQSPNAGEVIQMPRIVSTAGKAAMASLKPGDEVVTVYSQQTALNVKIIR